MTPADEDAPTRASDAQAHRQTILLAAVTVIIPPCVGVTMASRWGDDVKGDFYTTVAQVIATLFVAVTVDFFANVANRPRRYEGGTLVLLVLMGWTGFFACVRALAGHPTGVTAGLATTGLAATEILVSLGLYDHILRSSKEPARRTGALLLVLAFVAAPVSVLIVA